MRKSKNKIKRNAENIEKRPMIIKLVYYYFIIEKKWGE
jgi:hypothetical protein